MDKFALLNLDSEDICLLNSKMAMHEISCYHQNTHTIYVGNISVLHESEDLSEDLRTQTRGKHLLIAIYFVLIQNNLLLFFL